MLGLIPGATRLGRDYTPPYAHNGRHTISPVLISPDSKETNGGDVIALPIQDGGKIVRWGVLATEGKSSGLYIDILMKNGMTSRVLDLNELPGGTTKKNGALYWRGQKTGNILRNNQITVNAGSLLGTASPNSYSPTTKIETGMGVHLTVIRKGRYNNFLTAHAGGKDTSPYLMDPLGSESPFSCPQYKDIIYTDYNNPSSFKKY